MGPQQVKGRNEPVECFRAPGPPLDGTQGVATPMSDPRGIERRRVFGFRLGPPLGSGPDGVTRTNPPPPARVGPNLPQFPPTHNLLSSSVQHFLTIFDNFLPKKSVKRITVFICGCQKFWIYNWCWGFISFHNLSSVKNKSRMLGKYVCNPLPAGMYWNNLPAGDMVRVCIEGFLANGDLPIPPLRPVREYATHASATRRAFQMDFPAGAIVPKPSSKHKPNVDQPSPPPYSSASGTKRTFL